MSELRFARARAVKELIQSLEGPAARAGTHETPLRVAKAYEEWFSGYGANPQDVLRTFEDGAEEADEMILQRDVPVWSHCEHHMVPFFGVAHVAYVPDKRIVGLSKINRLVEVFARRLQVQERLTAQIAQALDEFLAPRGVAVVLECRHLCMESRGIRAMGTRTLTSKLIGVFREDEKARREFLSLARSNRSEF